MTLQRRPVETEAALKDDPGTSRTKSQVTTSADIGGPATRRRHRSAADALAECEADVAQIGTRLTAMEHASSMTGGAR